MNKKDFSIIKRAKSLTHAVRGISIILKTQHNFWVHMLAAILAVILGVYYKIQIIEWIAIVFSIGFVFVAEAVNTAIEIDIDLTSPNYHPYAKDTKDVAAGAVLISGVISWVIGLIIFIPKIIYFSFAQLIS